MDDYQSKMDARMGIIVPVPPMIPTTLRDRLKLAWEGWRTTSKRNPAYSTEREIARRKLLIAALAKLPVDAGWIRLRQMPTEASVKALVDALPALPFADQALIMMELTRNTPAALSLKPLQAWCRANASLIADISR